MEHPVGSQGGPHTPHQLEGHQGVDTMQHPCSIAQHLEGHSILSGGKSDTKSMFEAEYGIKPPWLVLAPYISSSEGWVEGEARDDSVVVQQLQVHLGLSLIHI